MVWLLACAGVFLGALPAQADAGGLLASNPDGRDELDDAPGAVTLVFDGKVDDGVAKVLVLDAKGANVTAGPLIVETTNVTTQLEDGLPKGTYTVHYRVDGKGGEPRGGAFQFSYGGGRFTDLPDASWSGSANEPAILRGDNPNGPEASGPAESESPGVEVTSSEKPDRTTQAPPPDRPTRTTPTTRRPDRGHRDGLRRPVRGDGLRGPRRLRRRHRVPRRRHRAAARRSAARRTASTAAASGAPTRRRPARASRHRGIRRPAALE